MSNEMKESHQLNIMLPGCLCCINDGRIGTPHSNTSFKGKDAEECLMITKQVSAGLIDKLARLTRFHEQIYNLHEGKPAKLNRLTDSSMAGIEFKIRLMFCVGLEKDDVASRFDLFYNPEE